MSNTVVLVENPFDISTHETFKDVGNVTDFLRSQYGVKLPDNARIYHGESVAKSHDVTPEGVDRASMCLSLERFSLLEGEFHVVIFPDFFLFGILGAGFIGTLVKIFLVGALLFLLSPKPAKPRNQRAASPNNQLSDRKNEPRINARIPDIFGQVRSTPDLIAPSYTEFVNHQQVEFSLMCIGRGEYETSDEKDDTTLIDNISGADISIYAPFTSPNSGDAPQKIIGDAITDPMLAAKRSNSVTGQVLKAPNLNRINGDSNLIFKSPDTIEALVDTDVNFTDFFSKGDNVSVTMSGFTGPPDSPFPGGTVNFNQNLPGYTVLGVEANFLSFENPASVDSAWDDLAVFFRSGETDPGDAILITDSEKWVGPFLLDVSTLTQVFVNVVAVNGLFKDNGTEQKIINLDIELELEPFDKNGNSIGPVEIFTTTIFGSAISRSQRAVTLKATPTFTGRCKVRLRRVTDTNKSFDGQISDELKWQDLYAISPVTQEHFGDITMIHSVTVANAGALSIKDRKLNMLVTRKIHTRGDTSTPKVASSRMDDIFTAIAIDPKIGNRSQSEIDVDNIYDTVQEIEDYFGTDKAVQFGHTFDNDDASFEETITSIADTMHCRVFRVGNILKISFEKLRTDSSLLFNHRNKLPGTEKRSVTFGFLDDNDGIEFEYVDGETEDDAIVRFFVPEDESAENAKVIESIGIRSKLQARYQAYRLFNRLLYQNVGVEFEATSEAALLGINDRVLVADNTRTDTQDAEVVDQSGLIITLSQPVTLDAAKDYTIFLQLRDRTIESMPVVAGATDMEVLLSRAPMISLVVDDDAYLRTLVQIIENTSSRESTFLIKEREVQDKGTFNVQCVNYDDRYYSNDQDFVTGVVDEFGEVI